MTIFRDLYAQTMQEIVGEGDPEDYYYWVYDGMGLSPQQMIQMGFLSSSEWQGIGQDWNDIKNIVDQKLNCGQ